MRRDAFSGKMTCNAISAQMTTMLRAFGLVVVMALGTSVAQAGCDTQDFEGTPITACAIDPATDDLRLFLYDAEGAPFGSFDALNDALGAEQLQLDIAMNGGMFHTDRAPVGHYVEEGTEVVRVITSEGAGQLRIAAQWGFLSVGRAGHDHRKPDLCRRSSDVPVCDPIRAYASD